MYLKKFSTSFFLFDFFNCFELRSKIVFFNYFELR
jgi:hypothetical protein